MMRYTAICPRFMLGGPWQAGRFHSGVMRLRLHDITHKVQFRWSFSRLLRVVAIAKRRRKSKGKGKQIISKWRVSYVNENGTRMPCLGPLGYTKLKNARGIAGVKVACATLPRQQPGYGAFDDHLQMHGARKRGMKTIVLVPRRGLKCSHL